MYSVTLLKASFGAFIVVKLLQFANISLIFLTFSPLKAVKSRVIKELQPLNIFAVFLTFIGLNLSKGNIFFSFLHSENIKLRSSNFSPKLGSITEIKFLQLSKK